MKRPILRIGGDQVIISGPDGDGGTTFIRHGGGSGAIAGTAIAIA
jgi:hypothetical protein